MQTTCLRAFLFGFLLPVIGLAAEGGRRPAQPWFPKAPPLAAPIGPVVRVAGVDELYAAARDIQPGGTILVADGHYRLPRYFELHADNVTLRSESGQRDNVVLDGQGRLGELVGITGCSGVTIADLTVQNVKWNGIKLNSDRGVTRVTIYNCVIHNIWQRGIKGVMVPPAQANGGRQPVRQSGIKGVTVPPARANSGRQSVRQRGMKDVMVSQEDRLRPSDCRVQYCLFYNDRPKRYEDDEADRPDNFGGNYIGGIDVMVAQRWMVSDNVFVGIQGRTGEARGAIFLWVDARDCVIERNIVIDCDSGICLGNSHRGADTPVHCSGCVVRNNFVTRCPENGILADYTRDCRILHNTIHDPGSRLRRLIRLVHDNDGLVVANNLLSGPEMRVETSSAVQITGNQSRDAGDWLVQADRGDLHLKTDAQSVVPRVTRSADVLEDIDGQRRAEPTAVGADDVAQPPA